MRARLLVVAVLLGFVQAALAETLERRFPEHNFSIEVPQWWMAPTPLPPQAIIAVRSPKKDRSIFVSDSTSKRYTNATDQDLAGLARQVFGEQKLTVTGEGKQESNGLTWVTATAKGPEGLTTTMWLLRVENTIYSLRADLAGGNVDADPEIQASLRSFRLLHPPGAEPGMVFNFADFWLPVGIGVAILLAGIVIFFIVREPPPRRKR